MIPKKWLEEAKDRIRPYIKHIPIAYDSKHELYLKWENHQTTHSFKDRGALNKILSLQPWDYQHKVRMRNNILLIYRIHLHKKHILRLNFYNTEGIHQN